MEPNASVNNHLHLGYCLAFLARLDFPRLRHVKFATGHAGQSVRDYHANAQTWLPRGVVSLSLPYFRSSELGPDGLVFYAALGSLETLCLCGERSRVSASMVGP
jgi:hypothetical protein